METKETEKDDGCGACGCMAIGCLVEIIGFVIFVVLLCLHGWDSAVGSFWESYGKVLDGIIYFAAGLFALGLVCAAVKAVIGLFKKKK